MFELHERLKADTFSITRMKLSVLLLMNDQTVPWIILVPERENIREIHDLDREDRLLLMEEIAMVSRLLQHLYKPDKINIGALGNIVPQLHLHVIGRYQHDRAWPGPIWGTGPIEPYEKGMAEMTIEQMQKAIAESL